ncbi:hypothetical protein E2C01_004987 [Portunus trituberculatus]|uniref:Uncharacterized protein n=1 Tax=Portunus trituberculatus TaxID=210409 RepID=A0A5B7CXW4_PORTR|nr:hypothetical protein [Portunus trituberculatus]
MIKRKNTLDLDLDNDATSDAEFPLSQAFVSAAPLEGLPHSYDGPPSLPVRESTFRRTILSGTEIEAALQ